MGSPGNGQELGRFLSCGGRLVPSWRTPVQNPPFFADVPCIEMIDPLAECLGAAVGGHITYSYADAVRLAGHSCPTVAGAYLMTKLSLDRLYGSETPLRGGIRVELRDAVDAGVTGVIANVIGLITGAAGPGGFKGIGGRFKRAGLLAFGVKQARSVRFTRLDTGQSLGAEFDASMVAPHESQQSLLKAILSGQATAADTARFGELWQQRVAKLLTSPELWPQMVRFG